MKKLFQNKAFNLSSASVTARLEFKDPSVAEKVMSNDFLYQYIPALSKPSTLNRSDVRILVTETNELPDFSKYPNLEIGAKGMSEKDIISLIELVFERARQEKAVYCIHSSSVVYKDKLVVFWGGATGMGKTRLAHEFIGHGASFYSDEKTLVDFSSLSGAGGIAGGHLKTKILFPKVGLFVYGFGIDGANLSIEKWSSRHFKWHLYEELGRKIRAISRMVKNQTVSIPSADSQKNADARLKLTKEFTEKIHCYFLQGSPSEVITSIIKILS